VWWKKQQEQYYQGSSRLDIIQNRVGDVCLPNLALSFLVARKTHTHTTNIHPHKHTHVHTHPPHPHIYVHTRAPVHRHTHVRTSFTHPQTHTHARTYFPFRTHPPVLLAMTDFYGSSGGQYDQLDDETSVTNDGLDFQGTTRRRCPPVSPVTFV
jgi:hypothetical protein